MFLRAPTAGALNNLLIIIITKNLAFQSFNNAWNEDHNSNLS